MSEKTHVTEPKEAHMVDISENRDVYREATAAGKIYLTKETLKAIENGMIFNGNVLATAQVAGILALKQTSCLIPMCHTVAINTADIYFKQTDEYIEAFCMIKTFGKFGIEVEALTGVLIALDTIWGMVKYNEKDDSGEYPKTHIEDVRVVEHVKNVIVEM